MSAPNDVSVEFITKGASFGDVGSRLMAHNFDPGAIRPYIAPNGHQYFTVNSGNGPQQMPLVTNDATLRYDEWKLIDRAVMDAARHPLKAWTDLRAAASYDIPNGLGVSTLLNQAASDPGEAQITVDGLQQDSNDRQLFDLTTLPLPIISSGFSFSLRELETGRRAGTPLDVSRAEQASRRVAEALEALTIGSRTFAGWGSNVYGYTNYPNRLTATVVTPTSSNQATVVSQFLGFRQSLINAKMSGPYRVYVGSAWDEFLDTDFKANGALTLRERLLKIQGFTSIDTLFGLSGFSVVIVQLTSNVARAVTGMPITTVQWESNGGFNRHFRVMTIAVPHLRRDYYGNTGILHATTV